MSDNTFREVLDLLDKSAICRQDRFILKLALNELKTENRKLKNNIDETIKYLQAHTFMEYLELSKVNYAIKILKGNNNEK